MEHVETMSSWVLSNVSVRMAGSEFDVHIVRRSESIHETIEMFIFVLSLASRTITIVLPLGNNTYNNQTFIDIGRLFPNTSNTSITIDVIR